MAKRGIIDTIDFITTIILIFNGLLVVSSLFFVFVKFGLDKISDHVDFTNIITLFLGGPLFINITFGIYLVIGLSALYWAFRIFTKSK